MPRFHVIAKSLDISEVMDCDFVHFGTTGGVVFYGGPATYSADGKTISYGKVLLSLSSYDVVRRLPDEEA